MTNQLQLHCREGSCKCIKTSPSCSAMIWITLYQAWLQLCNPGDPSFKSQFVLDQDCTLGFQNWLWCPWLCKKKYNQPRSQLPSVICCLLRCGYLPKIWTDLDMMVPMISAALTTVFSFTEINWHFHRLFNSNKCWKATFTTYLIYF